MQMRLHDVVVNEIPKFQSLEPTDLSHTISTRGDNIEDVLIITLDLNGIMSYFPTFKPPKRYLIPVLYFMSLHMEALHMIPLQNMLASKKLRCRIQGSI
jgi:hypothetical protein